MRIKISCYEELIAEYPQLALFDQHDAIWLAYLTGEVDGRRNLLDRIALHRELKAKELEQKLKDDDV